MAKAEVIFAGNKKVNVLFNGFEIKTDQPVHAGGEGTAPTPYDYFLASLAACAGFFAISFFQTRNLNSEGFKIEVDYQWDKVKHKLSNVDIKLTLPKDFPEKYIQALEQTVNLCSVKKTIADPPEFKTIITR